MTSAVHTPVTLLTGFLGSGKTTLLNQVLRSPGGGRTAVVINEFGEIALDHAIAASSDDTIMVLENGCLCCTVFGNLVGTLNRLYHVREAGEIPPFDHVVVETSGLADPSPLIQAFLSDPTLAGLYRLATVVALVDAVNGKETLDRHVESVRQVALADHILLTKLDLHGEAESAEAALVQRLRKLNPAANIARIDDPSVNAVGILRSPGFDPDQDAKEVRPWLNSQAYVHHDCSGDEASGPASAHADHAGHAHALHDRDIASFSFIRDEPIPREALRLLLDGLQQNLGPNLLRVKGIMHVAEEPDRPAIIQGAQHLLHNLSWLDRWPDDDRRSKIVFITQGYDRAEVEDIISVLDRVARRTAAARSRAKPAD